MGDFEELEYHFLVENTTIEREIFPNKTALSKTHVKTNTMGSTQWAYHKESNLAIYHFNFFFENSVVV